MVLYFTNHVFVILEINFSTFFFFVQKYICNDIQNSPFFNFNTKFGNILNEYLISSPIYSENPINNIKRALQRYLNLINFQYIEDENSIKLVAKSLQRKLSPFFNCLFIDIN